VALEQSFGRSALSLFLDPLFECFQGLFQTTAMIWPEMTENEHPGFS
jgi:hypothetical protein